MECFTPNEKKRSPDSELMIEYLRAFSTDLIADFSSTSKLPAASLKRSVKVTEAIDQLIPRYLSRVKKQSQMRSSLALVEIISVLKKIEDMMPSLKAARSVLLKTDCFFVFRLSRVIKLTAAFGRQTLKHPSYISQHLAETEEDTQVYIKSLCGSLVDMVPRNSDDLIHIVTTLRFLKHLEEIVDALFIYATKSEV